MKAMRGWRNAAITGIIAGYSHVHWSRDFPPINRRRNAQRSARRMYPEHLRGVPDLSAAMPHDLTMQTLVEDFLQYLRHERAAVRITRQKLTPRCSANSPRGRRNAGKSHGLEDQVELKHLMAFFSATRACASAGRRAARNPRKRLERRVFIYRRDLRGVCGRFTNLHENEKILPAESGGKSFAAAPVEGRSAESVEATTKSPSCSRQRNRQRLTPCAIRRFSNWLTPLDCA